MQDNSLIELWSIARAIISTNNNVFHNLITMNPYRVYVFDSSTANEAALAVRDGRFHSIIHYHSAKHQVPERDYKLQKLDQIAHHTNQFPPGMSQQQQQQPLPLPPSQMQPPSQLSAMQPQLPPQTQPPQPPQMQQPPLPPQQQPSPPQQPSPQRLQPTPNQLVKQEPRHQQQHLDPLSSMAAMSECPNMDSYGHTIHHHPPS